MEPIERVMNCPNDPFVEEDDSRVNCFECFAETPCYNVLTAQYSIRQSRPKFLSICPFRKRLRMEFALSRKALAKFLAKKASEPIVDLPEIEENLRKTFSVWELARSMSEWMKGSISSVMSSVKKAPIIEEPILRIKEFPLTEESVKKHIEKETAKKKEEKQETVLMLKKKQQELKRLKDELKLQAEKQYCHHDEKLDDYETEKMRYLQRLADEHNLRLKDLIASGDIIYQNYRLEMKKLNERKLREIEKRAEINTRLLQEELNRQKQLKKLKSFSVPKFITKKVKEPTSTPVQEEVEEEEEEEEKEDPKSVSFLLDSKEQKSMRYKPALGKSSKWKLVKSAHLIKSKLRVTDPSRALKPKQRVDVTSPDKMDQELKDMIKKLEEMWKEVDQNWNGENKELQLPENDFLIVRPTSIVFKDFLPYDDHAETVNIYNPTKEVIDCAYFRSSVVPKSEENVFEVYPGLVMRIRPGGNQDFKVIFMTERWDEVKDGISGTVWFWAKVVKTNKFYRITISVQCIRFTSNIKVDNPIIQFNQVPSWVHSSSTKYLEITNYSKIDYDVYIHRKKDTESSSDVTQIESKLNPTDDIKTLKHNILQSLESTKYPSDHNSVEETKPPTDETPHTSPEKTKQVNYQNPEESEQPSNHTSPDKPKNQGQPKHLRRAGIQSRKPTMPVPQIQSQSHHNKQLTHNKTLKREESFTAAKDLLESIIEEVYQPFRIQLTRGVFLNRETKMCVPIEFLPQLAGNVERLEDQLVVSYEGRFLTKGEEVVTLIATMFQLPLSLSPAMVDMQVTMVGTGVWQTSFQIKNISKKFIKVKIQIPEKINKHFQARPSNFIIRPNQKEDVLLRAKIGWNILEDSGDMLDASLSLLEFPISVQANDLPQQILGTLAVISHPLALSMEPKSINLGFVNTFETVVEEIWLKNHTVVPLHFAFLNVPECCLIMPTYGFSIIGPAQKIKLQLLYSPSVREAGKPGGQAVHMFTLICTTLERLAAEKPSLQNFNPEEEVIRSSRVTPFKFDNEQVTTLQDLLKMPSEDCMSELGETNPKSIETLSFLNENLNAISFNEKKEVIRPLESFRLVKNSDIFVSGDTFTSAKNVTAQSMVSVSSPKERNTEPFISMNCMAIITDPICELSAQELVLPDTPYGSYSIASIHLRCPNEVSGYSCHCGRFLGLHDDPKQLQIRFQFFHDSGKELDVQPVSGYLNYGEKVKIYFILKPELDLQGSSRDVRPKKTKSTPKTRSEPRRHKSSEDRISRTRLLRLKNKPNVNFYTRVRCFISLKGPELFEPRSEQLLCDLFSKFVRPDIFVATPNSKEEIIFPKTAIGTNRVETLEVYNISNELVHLTRSHFNHKDIFICQPLPPSPWSYKEYKGVPLEPDQCLKLRLTFSPVEENYAEEYFELKAKNTIIPLKVSGYGVIPRYMLSSQFSLCKLEAAVGGKVEDFITITNKSEAELRFEIAKCFQMETTSSDVFRVLVNRYSPVKNIYKETFLDRSIIKDLQEKFYESDLPSPITVEPRVINIPPFKKAVIKIVFCPKKQFMGLKLTPSEDALGKTASQIHSKNTMEETPPTFYVQKVQLVLGRLTLISEWLIIGKIVTKDNKKRV